jgi:hypothetical protein
MPVSRRQLLRNSVFAAIACAASPMQGWTGAKSSPTKQPPKNSIDNAGLQHLDRAAFTRVVGSGFKVSTTSGKSSTVWLRLLKVEDLPALAPVNLGAMAVLPKHSTAPVTTSGFMLLFLGTLPKPLPQGTYTFEHPGLGKFSLLIVPDGRETYLAVINRL